MPNRMKKEAQADNVVEQKEEKGVKTTKAEGETKIPQTQSKPKKVESQYTVDEFVANAESLFGTKPECVKAALMKKDVAMCTKSEAEKIIKEFMKKEVK